MLILLPPSEGKTAPDAGAHLSLSALLGADQLTGPRHGVMEALAAVSARPEAASVLGLGARSAPEAALNLALTTAPCTPAWDLYTGVLYEAAGMRSLGRERTTAAVLESSVVIVSGLWGAVRATDPLPDHRLSMGVSLPPLGRLAAYWKPHLTPVIAGLAGGAGEPAGTTAPTTDRAGAGSGAGHRLVIDCRSGAYSPAWQPTPAQARNGLATVRVRVESQRADGSRTVVSHHAKHTRGLLTGALVRALASGDLRQDADADAVTALAGSLPGVRDAELGEPDRAGRRDLTLVLGV